MFLENEVKENSKNSFKTLEYILELSLDKLSQEVKFLNIDFYVSKRDGLLEANGELKIISGSLDADLTVFAGKLRNIDIKLNEVFRTYFLTSDGKLTKNINSKPLMRIGYTVYDMFYDSAKERISLLIGFILFDL